MKKRGQRFHHRRVGSLVSPGVSGLLLTVDPNQTGKSIREVQLYLDRFRDLLDDTPADCHSAVQTVKNGDSGSIASLLAAELAEFRTDNGKGQYGAVDSNGNEEGSADAAQMSRKRAEKRSKLFSVLETNCKGYIFINVPFVEDCCEDEEVESDDENVEDCGSASSHKRPREDTGDASTETHSSSADNQLADNVIALADVPRRRMFHPNPKVAALVERMFDELAAHPDRPIVRFTYRMFPVNVTCYPVITSILPTLRDVLMGVAPIPGRSVVKVGLVLTIKNNTKVEAAKQKLRSDIEASVPQNKFLLLPLGHRGVTLDGVLSIVVMHSTCCIGYAPQYTERKSYNLHDFGQKVTREVPPGQ